MADIKDQIPNARSTKSKLKPSPNSKHSALETMVEPENDECHSIRSLDMSVFSSIQPSLAGTLKIGYFSTDRACQTDESEIINLKETAKLMSDLVQEITMLKHNLSFTKMALQADYDAKIEARSIELYNRTNSHIAEIQKLHEERVRFIRHSFRTQLADAICRISKEYHKYYMLKGEVQNAQYRKEISQMAKIQEEQKHNERAQQEMLDLLQLQMANQDEEEEEESATRSPSISSQDERHAGEIRHLTDTISNLEDRIDEYSEILEQKTEEIRTIENECETLQAQLLNEQMKVDQAEREILELKLQLETEKKSSKFQMDKQKEHFDRMVQERIEKLKAETLEQRISAEKQKKSALHDEFTMTDSIWFEKKKSEKEISHESLLSHISRYKEIEKSQKQEIVRCQKEIDKSNKAWEMKVTILQQTLHALKDEMFLRTSLQRQSAKLQHAAITYASDSPSSINAEVSPSKSPSLVRKYQLPNVVRAPQSLQGDYGIDSNQENPAGIA